MLYLQLDLVGLFRRSEEVVSIGPPLAELAIYNNVANGVFRQSIGQNCLKHKRWIKSLKMINNNFYSGTYHWKLVLHIGHPRLQLLDPNSRATCVSEALVSPLSVWLCPRQTHCLSKAGTIIFCPLQGCVQGKPIVWPRRVQSFFPTTGLCPRQTYC